MLISIIELTDDEVHKNELSFLLVIDNNSH
jgi:hypothetical protein